ncbi:MAG: M50 family metallopeptidase [Anaerolineales bacterium]
MDVLTLVLAIASMIFSHELGHFLACKALNIEVEEFGFGLPPRILTMFTWKGTAYTLNWLPLGGFVRPLGESDPSIPNGLGAAVPWKRFSVYFAGPLMNLLMAMVLYAASFSHTGLPAVDQVSIQALAPHSPAEQAGIQVGDLLVSMAAQPVTGMESVHAIVAPHKGEEIEVVVQRAGRQYTYNVLVRANPPAGEGSLGIVMSNPLRQVNIIQALPYGASAVVGQAYLLVTLPVQISQGLVSPEEARLVGYKGMYDMYKAVQEVEATPQATPSGLNTLSFFAMISASLGILNLIPIPAVDGGRILFLLPEVIFRRRIPQNVEMTINSISLLLLMALLVYINVQDFINPATFNLVP